MKCRINSKKCKTFLNFGKMPLANGFLGKKDFNKEFFFNLKVSFNENLNLVQINENPKPEQMFNKNYPFFTGSSKLMKKHFENFSSWIKKEYKSINNIIEIGSNDGTFLSTFKNANIIGFEPSKSAHDISKKKNKSINLFFNLENINYAKNFKKNTDLVVGANVICHIPDQINLIKSIDHVLKKRGLFIFEEPYLGSMYEKISYDQIYDEHIYIFSATSVSKIYNLFDFELFDAFPQSTHGGSMRYVVGRKGVNKKTPRLLKILEDEKIKKIDSYIGCLNFASKVKHSKNNFIKKLIQIKSKGERICGYGATSKSTTILNYCKINSDLIDCIFDTTNEKIGKYSPGMHIPIINYNNFHKLNYKKVILFAWNHQKEIFKKEKKKKKNIEWISHLN
jgi:methylation protein EvaC